MFLRVFNFGDGYEINEDAGKHDLRVLIVLKVFDGIWRSDFSAINFWPIVTSVQKQGKRKKPQSNQNCGAYQTDREDDSREESSWRRRDVKEVKRDRTRCSSSTF